MTQESPLVFVDVDTQRDFLEPSGALFIPGSEAIRPHLARLTSYALSSGIPIVATACDHTPDDEEFRIFPPHCVSGTVGQRRIAETEVEGGATLRPTQAFSHKHSRCLVLNKSTFDVFSRSDAQAVFEAYDPEKRVLFVVYGVATDFCVKAVIEGLQSREHRVAIVVDAIRAIDRDQEAILLTDFVQRGALLTLTEVVCSDSFSAD